MKFLRCILFVTFFAFNLGFFSIVSPQILSAQTGGRNFLKRGEVVSQVVQRFDLKNKKKVFLKNCMEHVSECFFVFGARSHFHKLKFEPTLILYPDVQPAYLYSDEINTATMLDLVQGYPDQKESPFRPRAYMKRIEALKVILGAGELLSWQEHFELAGSLGGEGELKKQRTPFFDVSGAQDSMWWYPRYVNFALEKGIIDESKYFRPDEPITPEEFEDMLEKALGTVTK